MGHISVIVIDDHEMVLQGLQTLLNTHAGIKVEKTFTNGFDAIKDYEEGAIAIDVILTDIHMPRINGFETAQKILSINKKAKIIMISMELNRAYVEKAKSEGVLGYISKNAPIEELVDAIRTVYGGGNSFGILEDS